MNRRTTQLVQPFLDPLVDTPIIDIIDLHGWRRDIISAVIMEVVYGPLVPYQDKETLDAILNLAPTSQHTPMVDDRQSLIGRKKVSKARLKYRHINCIEGTRR
ncbi:hypothetical protein BDV23DRAFT_179558 [Aspergillus alliaceus]|uniref:Uncharacterized protein n=1 Tax=Petromyces alliaceus TaxID=209559 RepID=A0A5N7CJP4_PETAA|nr:hypothetical protein BDV23DRAFT_179558 [Aspergillus alliaceus]